MTPQEIKVRVEVARRREFLTHALVFSFVFILCCFIWIGMGFGPFWPMWVLLAFGLALFLEAIHVGSFTFVTKYFSFLRDEWEEEEIEKRLQKT